MHKNPLAGKSAEEIYDLLSGAKPSSTPLPRWPAPEVQAGFIARSGVSAVRLTQDYLDLLVKDGAFKGDWKGLDYGCGFGRFTSLMLQYGIPAQVDMADPMTRVQKMIKESGFENRFFLIPQILTDGDLPKEYDFVFTYSVFTHFAHEPFVKNFAQLLSVLKPGGTFYATFRQEDFLPQFCKYWYKDGAAEKEKAYREQLRKEKFLYVAIIDHPDRKDFWGSAFVEPEFLRNLLPSGYKMDFLGDPDHSQKLYAFRAPK